MIASNTRAGRRAGSGTPAGVHEIVADANPVVRSFAPNHRLLA
jgi:hypothetical protein